KNPELGRKLIDWATSPAMQGLYAKHKINFVPAHPDVAIEPSLAEVLKGAKIFPIDDAYAGANRKRIVERWVNEVLNLKDWPHPVHRARDAFPHFCSPSRCCWRCSASSSCCRWGACSRECCSRAGDYPRPRRWRFWPTPISSARSRTASSSRCLSASQARRSA